LPVTLDSADKTTRRVASRYATVSRTPQVWRARNSGRRTWQSGPGAAIPWIAGTGPARRPLVARLFLAEAVGDGLERGLRLLAVLADLGVAVDPLLGLLRHLEPEDFLGELDLEAGGHP